MSIGLIYLGRRGAGGWISYELAQSLQHTYPTLTVTSQYLESHYAWQALRTEHIVIRTFRNAGLALLSLLLPIQVNRLVKQIRHHQPDVLLFPMFHPWNALIQKRLLEIPSVVFVHDPAPHPDLAGWLYGKLEQLSIKQAQRCIILSESLMEALIARGIPAARIDVIPLGPFRFSPDRQLVRPQNSPPTILFFGRIIPYKGLEILLQAYADLRQTQQARLVIAGEGDLKPFQDILKQLPDVEILNYWIPENEIEQLFSHSDLLVLPYTSATQSGVIPIAAACGLPVIATRTGGIPEQIEDGVSGWLVQPGLRGPLADAMKDALTHPDLARQRGEVLHRRYESSFNWNAIALRVEESLKKATQTRVQS